MIQMTLKVASILRKRQQNEWILLRKPSWTVCSPVRARFRGKKGFEVLRISPPGHVSQLRENMTFSSRHIRYDTEICVMSMRCQSSGTVSGAHVLWPTTVTSKLNGLSKLKSLTCSKFKSLSNLGFMTCRYRIAHDIYLCYIYNIDLFVVLILIRMVWYEY